MKNYFTQIRLPRDTNSKELPKECAAAIRETVSVLKIALANLDENNFSASFKKRLPAIHKATDLAAVERKRLSQGDIILLYENTSEDLKPVTGVYIYEGVGNE